MIWGVFLLSHEILSWFFISNACKVACLSHHNLSTVMMKVLQMYTNLTNLTSWLALVTSDSFLGD